MTNKQKKMADIYLTEPVTKTEAYRRAYTVLPDTKESSVHQQTSVAFRHPQVLAYLAERSDKIQQDMIELGEISKRYAKEGGNSGAAYASVAKAVYADTLDRVHGKATQRVESRSESVVISIDLGTQLED
jgi:hypothetical protein